MRAVTMHAISAMAEFTGAVGKNATAENNEITATTPQPTIVKAKQITTSSSTIFSLRLTVNP
ncbi:hypothetical protein D3C72_2486300 [compost metagenome]